MAKLSGAPHREILEAALHGLESQKQRIDEQIAQVRSLLGGKVAKSASFGAAVSSGAMAGRKRVLSPEARQRIAAAQKKRWAAYRRNKQ